MTGKKLALFAALLAGAGALIWAIRHTSESRVEPAATVDSADPAAIGAARLGYARIDSPLAALLRVARGDGGWLAWQRVAAALEAGSAGDRLSDGVPGDRRGRSFWDGEADLDGARGLARGAVGDLGPAATPARHREPTMQGRTYRVPRAGRRTILTSGRRIAPPRIRMPQTTALDFELGDRDRIPVRVEVCVDRSGRPQDANVLEGTGVPALDRYVARRMLDGRYRPLSLDGRRVRFCERSTVILGE